MIGNPQPWQIALYLIASYLIGSIPTAYLLARWAKGVDIRQFGSGNVGGSNAYGVMGKTGLVVVIIVDIGKATLVSFVALHLLDWGYPVAVAAGIMACLGHNWSIFLNFTGGRGMSTYAGFLLVVYPLGVVILFGLAILTYLFKSTIGTTIAVLILPLTSYLLGQPAAVTWGCVVMIVISGLKRLHANGRPLPQGKERWAVIGRRLWLDRDIADHKEWLAQKPPE